MRVVLALILSVCLLLGVLLRYAPFSALLGKTAKRRLMLSYAVLSLLNTVVLCGLLHQESWLRLLRHDYFLLPIVSTLINACALKKHLKEHLFVYGIVITCNLTLVSLVSLLGKLLPDMEPTQNYLISSVIYLLLLLLCYVPEKLLLRRTVEPFLMMSSGDYWVTIWFIPIAAYFSMLFVSEGLLQVSSVYQLVGRALICSVAVLMCLTVARSHQHMRTMQSMEERLSMQQAHYNSMAVRVRDLRRIRHDYKHLRSAVRGYIEVEDKEGLFAFEKSFVAEGIDIDENIPYTGNAAADGVLYYYMNRAAEKNISMELRGTIKTPGIADMDLSVLLGNALDNALNACLTVEEGRFITVIASSEERVLSLMVRNSFDGVVVRRKEEFLSRRRDNAPGLGMAAMEMICRKYGGSMETVWDETTFTLMLLLPLGENGI